MSASLSALLQRPDTALTPQQFVEAVISQSPNALNHPQASGFGAAPVNIALSKYWGKRDAALNLPVNGSLSISLPGLGTQTTLTLTEGTRDIIELNGHALAHDAPFAQRLSRFLDYFRAPGYAYHVITHNTVPTAAGLASSASGYAALVLALNDLYQWQLSKESLSLLARFGSGSASRSLFDGFALWHRGQRQDGLDSYAEAIDARWPAFCVGLLKVDIGEKPVSSSAGMQQTVQTCALYPAWPAKAEADMKTIHEAIAARDFSGLGATAEHNALTMHATMIATWPPIVYWQPESVAAMHKVWELRRQGIEVYFTMDAGPNLKLLFLETQKPAVMQAFEGMQIIQPFAIA